MQNINVLILIIVLLSACSQDDNSDVQSSDDGYEVNAVLNVDQDKSQNQDDQSNGDLESDPFELTDAWLEGTNLKITVSYGGGCEPHDFELAWPEVIDLAFPPTFDVVLYHNANNDFCEAYLTETLTIDLSNNGIIIEEQLPVMQVGIINASNPAEIVYIND